MKKKFLSVAVWNRDLQLESCPAGHSVALESKACNTQVVDFCFSFLCFSQFSGFFSASIYGVGGLVFCATQPARAECYYPACNLHIRKSDPAAMKGKSFIIHGLVNVGAMG